MRNTVLKVDDLHPDDVHIRIRWDAMDVGYSAFVPCLNTTLATKQAKKIVKARGWTATVRPVIENQLLGVRIWRTT